MTTEEILALPAGPEMDRLISQRLFGWRWWRRRHYSYGAELVKGKAQIVVYPLRECHTPYRFFGPPTASADANDLPGWEATPWDGIEELPITGGGSAAAYSTSIAAAWEIVKQLTRIVGRSDFHLDYDCGGGEGSGAHWLAFFPGPTDARAETAPLAICRCALLCYAAGTENTK